MRVLGVSAFYHDAAAALVEDGRILGAAQEERFTRKKHDPSFPDHAIAWLLHEFGRDLDWVVFYEKPLLKFDRLLETHIGIAPSGFRAFRTAMPLWIRQKLFQRLILGRALSQHLPGLPFRERLLFVEHHLSHAGSAFFASPFEHAAILTLDGVGEWATTTTGTGRETSLQLLREIRFPHSVGLLYSAFTQHVGFKPNSGEYKLMGLAPYGEPRYVQPILEHLIDVKEDGSFRLNPGFFDLVGGPSMAGSGFADLFGVERRKTGAPLTQAHADLAASVQEVVELVLLRITRELARTTGERNLCMAGGVALNAVANGKVLRDRHFRDVWVQPAAGDAGGALGSALVISHTLGTSSRRDGEADSMRGALLGPGFSDDDVERRLKQRGACLDVLEWDALLDVVADQLALGRIVGWFQDRMEFGPRALGARSILADARDPAMQQRLNAVIKHREAFRPFAPCVLEEDAAQWFDLDAPSRYMLNTVQVAARQSVCVAPEDLARRGLSRLGIKTTSIPAVTHVDGSARVQTVHAGTHPRLHELLARFKKRTGCPVLLNTSFNVRGEPLVCNPEDAFDCFLRTRLDLLAAGRCLLWQEAQTQEPSPAQFEDD